MRKLAPRSTGFWRQLPELRLSLWGLALNAVWEAVQSPLYADFDRGFSYLVRTRLHCSGGDVLILLAAFWLTALVFWDRQWAERRGWLAAGFFVAVGLTYTVWSEIHNTQIVRGWEYAASMPRIAGIGLSPLLQWLVIPPVVVAVLRRKPAFLSAR